MAIRSRTTKLTLWISGAVIALSPIALPTAAHANGQQCNSGPIPVISNTNCQGDSGSGYHGGDGGASSSSSSSSSSSGSSGSGGGGGNSGNGAGGNSGRQG